MFAHPGKHAFKIVRLELIGTKFVVSTPARHSERLSALTWEMRREAMQHNRRRRDSAALHIRLAQRVTYASSNTPGYYFQEDVSDSVSHKGCHQY